MKIDLSDVTPREKNLCVLTQESRIYTPEDVASHGHTEQDMATLSMVDDSFVQYGRGIYYRAHWNKLLKAWDKASPDELIHAVAARDGFKLLITASVAANKLGLSTQVPAKNVWYTEGATRELVIGGWKIYLQTASPETMYWAGHPGAIIIQALQWMGPAIVDRADWLVTKIKHAGWKDGSIPDEILQDLTQHKNHIPSYMEPLVKRLIV